MKILSIDIGIKNLAFCLFEKPLQEETSNKSEHFYIKKWEVINICENQTFLCKFIEKNQSQVCNKPAKFQKNNVCFCLKHSKKQPYLLPNSELKTSFIKKQKIQKLFEIADKYKITYDNNCKKADLILLIQEYIHSTCFEEVVVNKANNTDLITIGINIMTHFNSLFTEEDQIDFVIIENQISPIASRMKTIQGMIAQYFIMSDVSVDQIEFVSSINKLKEVFLSSDSNKINKDKQKLTYNDRKKLGINKCLEILTNEDRFNEKTDFFNSHKKKDDLADCFLQGLWFIQNKIT
jgi:hypothetical protein